jgi:hypothetical protein
MQVEFTAILERPPGAGTWTYLTAPLRVEEVFATRGRVAVRGTIDRQSFRGSLMPHGDGRHFIVVNKELRTLIRKGVGDSVNVQLELDCEPRNVDLPEELSRSLQQDQAAQNAFDRLSFSHRKEYVQWIESAKKAETRKRRVHRAIEMITTGKRFK